MAEKIKTFCVFRIFVVEFVLDAGRTRANTWLFVDRGEVTGIRVWPRKNKALRQSQTVAKNEEGSDTRTRRKEMGRRREN
jgi:hypothetical protein